jgi:hypothetical protein
VWYRRVRVRIRRYGWKLQVTPHGIWMLTHPGGGLVLVERPRTKRACARLARAMRAQERAIRARRGKKEDPWVRFPRTPDRGRGAL